MVHRMESKLQPNDTKSIPQKARDAASPGNDTQGQGQGMYEQVAGMAQGATEQVAGMAQTAKDGVVNMVYGQKKEERSLRSQVDLYDE